MHNQYYQSATKISKMIYFYVNGMRSLEELFEISLLLKTIRNDTNEILDYLLLWLLRNIKITPKNKYRRA